MGERLKRWLSSARQGGALLAETVQEWTGSSKKEELEPYTAAEANKAFFSQIRHFAKITINFDTRYSRFAGIKTPVLLGDTDLRWGHILYPKAVAIDQPDGSLAVFAFGEYRPPTHMIDGREEVDESSPERYGHQFANVIRGFTISAEDVELAKEGVVRNQEKKIQMLAEIARDTRDYKRLKKFKVPLDPAYREELKLRYGDAMSLAQNVYGFAIRQHIETEEYKEDDYIRASADGILDPDFDYSKLRQRFKHDINTLAQEEGPPPPEEASYTSPAQRYLYKQQIEINKGTEKKPDIHIVDLDTRIAGYLIRSVTQPEQLREMLVPVHVPEPWYNCTTKLGRPWDSATQQYTGPRIDTWDQDPNWPPPLFGAWDSRTGWERLPDPEPVAEEELMETHP